MGMQPYSFVYVLSVAVLYQNSHQQLSSYQGDCTSHKAQSAYCLTQCRRSMPTPALSHSQKGLPQWEGIRWPF